MKGMSRRQHTSALRKKSALVHLPHNLSRAERIAAIRKQLEGLPDDQFVALGQKRAGGLQSGSYLTKAQILYLLNRIEDRPEAGTGRKAGRTPEPC